jgi:hypothetical protein
MSAIADTSYKDCYGVFFYWYAECPNADYRGAMKFSDIACHMLAASASFAF